MSELFKLSPWKKTIRNLSALIHERSSGDPTHPENASDADWQAGYLVGCHTENESCEDIAAEWERRGRPGSQLIEGPDAWGLLQFRNWKAGYWAGVFGHLGEGKLEP